MRHDKPSSRQSFLEHSAPDPLWNGIREVILLSLPGGCGRELGSILMSPHLGEEGALSAGESVWKEVVKWREIYSQ